MLAKANGIRYAHIYEGEGDKTSRCIWYNHDFTVVGAAYAWEFVVSSLKIAYMHCHVTNLSLGHTTGIYNRIETTSTHARWSNTNRTDTIMTLMTS